MQTYHPTGNQWLPPVGVLLALLLLPAQLLHAAGATPTAPGNLTGTVNNGTATLNWDVPADDDGVEGYNIYIDNVYAHTVHSNRFETNLEPNRQYAFKVVAFDAAPRLFSPSSAVLTLSASQTPLNQPQTPSVPVGLSGHISTGGLTDIVSLNWQASTDDKGVAGYNIYRDGQYIATRTDTRYVGSVEAGSRHQFAIAAFDAEKNYSAKSEPYWIGSNEEPATSVPFSLSIAPASYTLQEGSDTGVRIPLTLNRTAGFQNTVTLSVNGANASDESRLSSRFSVVTLPTGVTASELTLQLAIDVLPIQAHQRHFTITASDGQQSSSTNLTVNVQPVARDDVYLIIGQSNAVGSSEAGARQSYPGGLDDAELRIRQANVQRNDHTLYPDNASYTDVETDLRLPALVTAQDPLHESVGSELQTKQGTQIGMYLSFAKTALPDTSNNIILVPAAWSASGFCNAVTPDAHWNAVPSTNPALGNTLLFDRALARVNKTLQISGGILRGILWHQGENDSNEACAPYYEENLALLTAELRRRIVVDARGEEARGPQANIPFVLGTMSKGRDERGDYSWFSSSKLIVDSVHRNIASLIPHAEVVLNDDLIPANGYPCGQGSCIHFGATALREMGARTHDALIRAAGN